MENFHILSVLTEILSLFRLNYCFSKYNILYLEAVISDLYTFIVDDLIF